MNRAILLLLFFCSLCVLADSVSLAQKRARKTRSTGDPFDPARCQFATRGETTYFILKPSYQLSYQGVESRDTTTLLVTVLDDTVKVGDVETRVVEERESVNGRLVEISRNYFAFCSQTNTAFYFGENVDLYKDGVITGHAGSWRADSGDARPGVMMPGAPLLGQHYSQENAPNTAMDEAEVLSITEAISTPGGSFENCLKILETTRLDPRTKEYKIYAPGVGLVKDGNLILVKYGRRQL